MLVDDPVETLQALCQLSNIVLNWDLYKLKYEQVKNRKKPVHVKTIDTHFYLLNILDLVRQVETEGEGYKITLMGKELCKLLDKPDKKDQFQKLLSTVLLENRDKGALFKAFLEFVESPKTLTAISKKFNTVPAKTLVPWTQLAGLIDVQKDTVWRLHRQPIGRPSIRLFREKLIEVYDEMQKTETYGVKRVFVNIDDLRIMVCYRLGGIAIREFDDLLTKLLESTEGRDIRLYGAPTTVFAERQNFNYHGKLYAYLSIGV